jgi:hypothetical protein
MKANREQDGRSTIHGTLLRFDPARFVAIYLRDGAVSVADFRDGRGRVMSLAEWHTVHARRLAHAQRRGEVEIVSPMPAEVAARIECLHGSSETPAHSLKQALGALPTEMRETFSRLARLLPDPVAAGSRMMGAGVFRVD